MPERRRRGYPVAVLIGFGQKQTTLWRIFSESARLDETLEAPKGDAKAEYAHYEALIDLIRPLTKAGIRSLMVASPPRLRLQAEFLEHVRKRHRWILEGGTAIGEIQGSADSPSQVQALVKGSVFTNVLGETTAQEAETLLGEIERGLDTDDVLFTLEEIQRSIRAEDKPRIILMTDAYYEEHRRSRRLQSIIQLAQNNLIQTRILRGESRAGVRLGQFGGVIAMRRPHGR